MPTRDPSSGRFVKGGGRVESGGAGLRISMEIFGDVQLNRSLLRVSQRARNLRPVFQELADQFIEIEQEQFDSEGGFSGGWAPLAQSTVERKAALGLDPRILHATLALRRSLTNASDENAVRRIGASQMLVGTAVKSKGGFPYAAVHQNPVTSHVPRRRPVELDEAHRRDWMKRIQTYIVGGKGAAGYA